MNSEQLSQSNNHSDDGCYIHCVLSMSYL